LSEEVWKTVPFQLTSKTLTDKLYDILMDIPGLANRVTVLPYSEREGWGLRANLESLQAQLSKWREEWQAHNPEPARLVKSTQTHQTTSLPLIDSILASSLRFQTPEQAVELLQYNSAMLYFSQLELILDGRHLDPQMVISTMESEANSILSLGNNGVTNPLLAPGEVRFPWQYWIEGLQITATMRGELSISTRVYVTFAPIAILYCFSRWLGVQQIMLPMISNEEWAEAAERELGIYDVFARVPHIEGSTNDPAHAESGRNLFINSSG
jgi:hypothetical protein